MKISCKVIISVFSFIYVSVTVLGIYNLYYRERNDYLQQGKYSPSYPQAIKKPRKNFLERKDIYIKKINQWADKTSTPYYHQVEIWGKAAIGLYLWKHIMNGKLEDSQGGLVQHGNVTIKNIIFTFRTGPGIIQSTVPSDVQYLVLVLNGRSQEKIDAATLWLDYLPVYRHLKKLAVILLGNEECNNGWILPYMKSRGGKIDLVFVVYDSRLVDNVEFYQWPLGVAVYREFPIIVPEEVDLTSFRSYLCNFFGTLYVNSSRQTLIDVMKSSHFQDDCIINGRKTWLPFETKETLNMYMHSILKSDLTLSPVGKNTECYRIYEAMSLGSVPVVEDVITPGNCDISSGSPLRLLKYYEAPVIYIKNWHDLPRILSQEAQLTLEEKVERRVTVTEWYMHFKNIMCDMFVHVVQEKFFDESISHF